MSLTIGTGPFGPKSSGRFNFERQGPAHVLYWDACPWRVRCELAGETIADSRSAMLLHETGLLPVYYLPRSDVREDLLTPTDHRTQCPFKGDARYWSITVGDRTAENAVWRYPSPLPHAPPLQDHVAFFWDRLDRWFEEDEEAIAHARDPFHRLDVMHSSRHVEVSIDGTVLAESRRPRILFETGLPPRYYLPRDDVRLDLLQPTDTRSVCAYKGSADQYWSFGEHADIAWSYAKPRVEVAAMAECICFYDDKVTVELD